MTPTTHHSGAPEGYDSLSEYFVSISDRADALGVSRDTIRSWDGHRASRVWVASRERVATLFAVCRELQAVMSEPAAVGRWLLTGQPAMMGARPTDVLLKLGMEGGRFVLLVAYGLGPVRPADVPDSATFWRAVQAKVSDGELAQIEDTRGRASAFTGSLSLA